MSQDSPIPIQLHWVDSKQDLLRIINLDRLCNLEEAWNEESWLIFLKSEGTLSWRICGLDGFTFGIVSLTIRKRHVRIEKLCVHPNWQRQGIGTGAMKRLKRMMIDVGKQHEMRAIVRDDALGVHLFLKACHFRAVRVLKAWDGENDWYEFRCTVQRDQL